MDTDKKRNRLLQFKNEYRLFEGETLNIKDKSKIKQSFKTTFGRPPGSKYEEGEFDTALWAFLTNLKSCKHWKELSGSEKKPTKDVYLFDNAIKTDGVSISFQVIKKSKFGRKHYGDPKQQKPENEQEFTSMIDIPESAKVLSVDPGKRDILYVTDGVKSISYTSGQKKQDIHDIVTKRVILSKRQKGGIHDFETTQLNQTNSKSCFYNNFRSYYKLKLTKYTEQNNVYTHPVFRQFKFLKYCKNKSSEDKFANRIRKTFMTSNIPEKESRAKCLPPEALANAKKKTDNLVIAWGNWGKSPNLKGSDPTPGIGIRRRFDQKFKTFTVNEAYTSKTCPCCKECPSLQKLEIKNCRRHSLLCCTNSECSSRWWNRNLAGSLNILFRAFNQIRGVES
jgi:hypothetical protein